MTRIVTLQLVCDDDLLENAPTPANVALTITFEPALNEAERPSMCGAIAAAFDAFLEQRGVYHTTEVAFTVEQHDKIAARIEAERLRELLDAPLVRLN